MSLILGESMIKVRSSCLYFSAVLFLLVSLLSPAQPFSKNYDLSIPKTEQSAIIDGELNDHVWNNALNISLNIVNNPWDNLPSPVKTKAKIIENGKFIYISFIASDPEPNKIHGFLGDRDSTWNEDLVGIKLDTFNNKQLNYNFFVNPFGVQNDSISNELTGDENQLWDANWQSFGKKTPTGYQVEIAIPYNILNFDDKDKEKTWGIEFVRFYPRDERLRISHVKFNKDNNCWLCQIPEIKGFENLKQSKNITITPSLVVSNNQQRDPFTEDKRWSEHNDIDPGIDIRWAPTANTLLNTTINPDFSTVESDSGQLSVNNATSLFFDEKRIFFLENSDYFSSNYNLVYTRNIADPDYGAKLTSRTDKYSYGVFITNDQQTNFIVPGNISDNIAVLNTESHSAALNYRYHYNEQLTLGLVSTLRTADNYHNVLGGADLKYKFNDSHTLNTQFLYSDTKYPNELFENFCLGNSCKTVSNQCTFGNCQFTEQVNRTNIEDNFGDTAYKIDYQYNNEFWDVNLTHQKIDNGFRADLGFISQVDIQKNEISVSRLFHGNKGDFWSETSYFGTWHNTKNENDEFIDRTFDIGIELLGPKLSLININIIQAKKTGLRHDDSILKLASNTSLFDEQVIKLYAEFKPINRVFIGAGFDFGDQIDYNNNRLGSFNELYLELTANLTDHLSLEFIHTFSELKANPVSTTVNDNVFTAHLTNFRISYQFDVESFIKLSLTYIDIEYNLDNNPLFEASNINKDLTTQLIYSYELNPQTVFFLGYSDNSFQDDGLNEVYRTEKIFFTKISYAWSI
jgi:hypothetical protein